MLYIWLLLGLLFFHKKCSILYILNDSFYKESDKAAENWMDGKQMMRDEYLAKYNNIYTYTYF